MNRKTTALVLILALASASAVFAEGQREDRFGPGGPMGPGRAGGPEISEDKVTVTGPVAFENRMHPVIESGGMEYELLVPRRFLWGVDVEEGQTVTVEGYTVTDMWCEAEEDEDDEVHLMVTLAKIGDEEYDLEARRGGPGAWGHGGWGHGGWGPGRRGRGGPPMGHHGPMGSRPMGKWGR